MRILLDPQAFLMQRYGGISRYVSEVYNQFLQTDSVTVKCPMLYSENLHLLENDLMPVFLSCIHSIQFKGKFRLVDKTLHKCTRQLVLNELKKKQTDIFFATYYNTYFLKGLDKIPYVITVYDMIHEFFPNYFLIDKTTVKNKLLLMQDAKRIIAISNNTKLDILRVYPFLDPDKIDVVYLYHSIKPKYKMVKGLPQNYLLYVGSRTGYKNFRFFIEAIAPVIKSNTDLFIVCAGGYAFTTNEKEMLSANGIEDKVLQRDFMDDELAFYYKNARLFVFPSEYEGFGIPVLEAMYCGCPVILPHHSSFPEVAGDAGVYFELNNKQDLADKVTLILNNDSLRKEYIQKGKLQEAKFGWKNTADGCLETIKRALH